MKLGAVPNICKYCPVAECSVRGMDQAIGSVAVTGARNLRGELHSATVALTGTPLPSRWLGGSGEDVVLPEDNLGVRLMLLEAIRSARMASSS